MFKRKPKPKPTHKVILQHTRPEYGDRVTFLKVYHVIAKDGQELKEIFEKSFQIAYPQRHLVSIDVEEIKD